ncbi:MAG: hypothetical protein IMZ63_01840 [Actinobacteria bacterium]|nr:hypothetical protein [Actinomycetota bacterium]
MVKHLKKNPNSLKEMVHKEAFIKITISIPKTTKQKLDNICKLNLRNQSNMIAFLIEKFEDK